MQHNKELLKKYNYPVPRYTSYPPANFFTEDFTSEQYLKALPESNQWQPENISVYIHIPFCKKMCFYCGCNMCPMGSNDLVQDYIAALKKEIQLIATKVDKSRKLTMVHYGGGTPNSIPVKYLEELNEHLRASFNFSSHAEIAIECNPAYLDKSYINSLLSAGFNRFSLGIQDFDTDVLKNVNRDASLLPVKEVVNQLRSGENTKVNLDFIYGLPGQTPESFSKSIVKAAELKPDRLVTFSYAHVPWVNKAQKALEKQGLPSSDDKIAMYQKAQSILTNSGYIEVGMDHYVLEKDELNTALNTGTLHRNFQGYCTREATGQVYAFGVSAISQLQQVYAQNTKSVADYIKSISNNQLPIIKGYKLSPEQSIIREAITTLMCNKKLNWEDIASLMQKDLATIKESIQIAPEILAQFQNDGIISLDADNNIEITEQGALYIRNVAASMDPLLADKTKTFSKPV